MTLNDKNGIHQLGSEQIDVEAAFQNLQALQALKYLHLNSLLPSICSNNNGVSVSLNLFMIIYYYYYYIKVYTFFYFPYFCISNALTIPCLLSKIFDFILTMQNVSANKIGELDG